MNTEQAKEAIKDCLPSYLNSIGIDIRKHFRCLDTVNHTDDKPSMKYNGRSKRCKCYGCGANLDIFDIIGIEYGLTEFNDQFQKACELFNITVDDRERKKFSCLDRKAYGIGGEGAHVVAEYQYRDGNGRYLYSKIRFEGGTIKGKEIRYYVVDREQDTATPGKGGNESVLYRLPEFRQMKRKAQYVFIAEGEKDVETLRKIGGGFGCATTAGGVSDWQAVFAREFTGCDVIILCDNDQPGRDLAENIKKDLKRYAHSVKIVCPSKIEKGDVTDFLTKEGGTAQSLKDICRSVTEMSYASWINLDENGREKGINAGILTETIAENEDYFIIRNATDDKDTLLFYEGGVYRRWNKNDMKNLIKEYVGAARATDSILNGVYNLFLASDHNVRGPSEVDGDPRYINFKNGLYDVRAKKLIPHDPKVFSTFQFDFDFDANNTKHPAFDKYINDLCRKPDGSIDQGEASIIQEYFGFVLSNEPMSRIKAALVLWSRQGNSGKSVLIRLISNMLGVDRIASIKLRELVSEQRFILGSLPECRVIACGDESNSNVTDSSIFKALTGGDPVKIEPKGRQGYSYIFRGGFVIACNGLPCFEDDRGNHLFDRLLILPCEHHVTEDAKDAELDDKLYRERQAIFNWALDGLYRLIDNGYRFSKSTSAMMSKEEYRCAMDNVYRFVSERYIITGNYTDRVLKSDFERAYRRWTESDSTIKAVAPKNLAARLEALGITSDRGNASGKEHVGIYRGIRERDEESDQKGSWRPDDGTVQAMFKTE